MEDPHYFKFALSPPASLASALLPAASAPPPWTLTFRVLEPKKFFLLNVVLVMEFSHSPRRITNIDKEQPLCFLCILFPVSSFKSLCKFLHLNVQSKILSISIWPRGFRHVTTNETCLISFDFKLRSLHGKNQHYVPTLYMVT